jgi:hypothetical protein
VTYYQEVLTGFVYDSRDSDLRFDMLKSVALDTLMQSTSDRVRLAREILDWIATWQTFESQLHSH